MISPPEPTSRQRADDRARAAFVTQLVALAFQLSAERVRAATRGDPAGVRARWAALYLTHLGFQTPLNRVASAFACDRSTVCKALNAVEDLRDDPVFDDALTVLEQCVRAAPSDPFSVPGAPA